jgi:hypothetical protein
MRNGLIVAVAAVSFGIGAWATTGFAQDRPGDTSALPAQVKVGDRLWVLGQSNEAPCEVTDVRRDWVQCSKRTWRNLVNGAAYEIRTKK